MKKLIIVAAALALIGCTQHFEHNQKANENARPATQAEKNGVLEAARNVLYDPYSVRDAEISPVVQWMDAFGNKTTVVCARFNSKNAYGGYTGRQQYLLYLKPNGSVSIANRDVFAQGHCNKMSFSRFQEADRLRDL